jgi:CheY-like chemotaxis protein
MQQTNARLSIGVLLIEDEALIRMMFVGMLEELGHRVVAEAGDVENGKLLAETADFDLAMLDVNLAGHLATPVAQILARRGKPFLFVTGYSPNAIPEEFSDRPYIQKPFVLGSLRDGIALALRFEIGA